MTDAYNASDRLIDQAAAIRAPAFFDQDRRGRDRHEYSVLVPLALLTPTGEVHEPVLVRTRDVSVGGLGVTSRYMIHPGAEGAVRLIRSDSSTVIVGVRVRYCRYVGDMEHHVGLQFIPASTKFKPSHFDGVSQRSNQDGEPSLKDGQESTR